MLLLTLLGFSALCPALAPWNQIGSILLLPISHLLQPHALWNNSAFVFSALVLVPEETLPAIPHPYWKLVS